MCPKGDHEAVDETLVTRFLERRDARGDETFATFVHGGEERSLSWNDLFRRVERFRALLEGHGVEPREKVFVVAPLGPDVLAAFLAGLAIRAIPSIMSYPSSKVAPSVYAKNLAHVLDTSGTRRVLTTRALQGALASAIPGREGDFFWIEDARDMPTGPLRATAPGDEVAFLQHSSGSTGLQKGVALSHRAVLNQVRHYARALSLDPEKDGVASWLPLYHDMGLIATFLLPLVTGTRVVYMDPFEWVTDPAILLEAISRHGSTLSWLPNFAYVHMARRVPRERSRGLDLSSVRGWINCSEPVRHASHEAFLERFRENGVREESLWACYAMAENTFAVTQSGGSAGRRLDWIDATAFASERQARPVPAGTGIPMVSNGPPIEGVEVKVVDEARRTLPERGVGEIALRSDSMLTEYHRNPEATKGALEGGFYFTGDLGYLADGHLYVTGRKKDLIIVGGRNFYPQDLEDVVSEQEGAIPGRGVAFGVENAALGTEEVVVVTETDEESPEGRAALVKRIKSAALERLDCAVARVELVPRGWVIKTSSGKVARKKNVEKYAELERRQPSTPTLPPRSGGREPVLPLLVEVLVALAIVALALVLMPARTAVVYGGF
jgi:acyl-CoA synthetase (AMP-forming)/AMP-acid ligase II